jgi:hypothetical protein
MISVADVAADAAMAAPQPFIILRSAGGQFVLGGFQSLTTAITTVGPVQRASDKEVNMMPEADRISGIMAFWAVQPIHVTQAKAPNTSTQGQAPQGAYPGTVYTLVGAINPSGISLLLNGLLLIPGKDYALAGNTITLIGWATQATDKLYCTQDINAANGLAASDILVYQGEQYRVLAVRHYPGSGYWKALGTRMSAS